MIGPVGEVHWCVPKAALQKRRPCGRPLHQRSCRVSDAELRAGKTKVTFYFVSPEDVEAYKLPSTIKGMSNLNVPSQEAARILLARGLKHLMRNETVPWPLHRTLASPRASPRSGL